MREKLRRDADAGIDDAEIRLGSIEPGIHGHLPARIGKLDRVGNHVPRNLLQTNRLAHHDQARRIQQHQEFNAASSSGSTDSIDRGFDGHVQVSRLGFKVQFPGRDSRSIEQVVDQARLQPRIPFNRIEGLRYALLIERAAAQQLDPSDYGCQRGSQFVRQRRKKNVLRAVRVRELNVEPLELGSALLDSLFQVEIQLLQIGACFLFGKHESPVFNATANRMLHRFDVARFDQVVVRAFLQGSDGGFDGSKSGKNYRDRQWR